MPKPMALFIPKLRIADPLQSSNSNGVTFRHWHFHKENVDNFFFKEWFQERLFCLTLVSFQWLSLCNRMFGKLYPVTWLSLALVFWDGFTLVSCNGRQQWFSNDPSFYTLVKFLPFFKHFFPLEFLLRFLFVLAFQSRKKKHKPASMNVEGS